MATRAKSDQTGGHSNNGSTGGMMSHALTVQTRRRKKRAQKDRALDAKRAKKARNQKAKPAAAR
jgi:hypothetical protein